MCPDVWPTYSVPLRGFQVHVRRLMMQAEGRRTAQRMNSIKSSKEQQNSVIVQELCESRGGRPGLSVLTSLLVSVDVKIY